MEKSQMPMLVWYKVMHLMTATKKNISALEMQKQVEWKRYEPIWTMMHKIRIAMGNRDGKYQLENVIEVDDAFYETVDEQKDIDEVQKRGRGSQKQASVLVMVESRPNPDQTKPYKKNRVMGYAKMLVMKDLRSEGINQEVELGVSPESTLITDGYNGYNNVNALVAAHRPEITPSKQASIKLPWVHTVISNAKRGLLGIHHSIGREYLQNYLNEYCYKLNRRYFKTDLFDRLLLAVI